MNKETLAKIEANAKHYAETQFYYDTDSDRGISFQSFSEGALYGHSLGVIEATKTETLLRDMICQIENQNSDGSLSAQWIMNLVREYLENPHPTHRQIGAMGMKTINYEIDLIKDPKGMLRFVRDDLRRILDSQGAKNIESGELKIRFLDWCLEREDAMEKFRIYCDVKSKNGEQAGFKAAGWDG